MHFEVVFFLFFLSAHIYLLIKLYHSLEETRKVKGRLKRKEHPGRQIQFVLIERKIEGWRFKFPVLMSALESAVVFKSYKPKI